MILKGHCIIQLFDAKTGKETDHVEGHNIITNAAHYLLNGCPYGLDRRTWNLSSASQATDWSSINEKVFGGVLVFPETIAESASHIFEPLTHYPVGYGSMLGQDTSDPRSGTFNAVESGALTNANGFKWVYDFGTSQANGTWTNVCLTSAKGGYGYIEGRLDGDIFDSLFRRDIGVSTMYCGSTANYIYFISSTYGTASLTRLKIPPFRVPLFGNNIQGNPIEVLTVNDTDRVFIDQANNRIYKMVITQETIDQVLRYVLTITRYNDEEDLTDTTTYTLAMPAEVTVPEYNRGRLDFCIRGNYLYMGNRGTKLLKVNLTDASDYDEINVSGHSHAYSIICASILASGDIYRYPEIIDSDDVPHTIGGSSTTGADTDVTCSFNNWAVRGIPSIGGYGASINTTYLATIKNLENPVPKNATKTGKITYILTEVSS